MRWSVRSNPLWKKGLISDRWSTKTRAVAFLFSQNLWCTILLLWGKVRRLGRQSVTAVGIVSIYTNLDVPVYKTRAMTAGQGNIIFPPFKTPIWRQHRLTPGLNNRSARTGTENPQLKYVVVAIFQFTKYLPPT